jgi:ATP-binding protein involved in chromosome partitioning
MGHLLNAGKPAQPAILALPDVKPCRPPARLPVSDRLDDRTRRQPPLASLSDSGVSMALTVEQLSAALAAVVDPNTGRDLIASRSARNLRVDGDQVSVDVELGYPAASQIGPIRTAVIDAIRALPGVGNVSANVYQKIVAHSAQRGVKLLPNVRNIIAVASGKGGVGKSTTAVNLALALAAEGATVGMLDADIYGPSQPTMLGITGRPETVDGKTLEPMEGHGIQASSIGFMIEPDTPMVWRGPMVTQALEQLLRDTNWRDLDYLIIDMPPGTGDIHLTLSQKIPVTGAIIVTTPQDIALLDARKGLKMFEKVGIPILGVVENMAIHVCSQCGHAEHIFGEGGGARMSADFGVEYLGGLPLDIRIREQTDSGRPTVVAEPDGAIAAAYRQIARRMAVKVAETAKDMSSKFPSIVVQNT